MNTQKEPALNDVFFAVTQHSAVLTLKVLSVKRDNSVLLARTKLLGAVSGQDEMYHHQAFKQLSLLAGESLFEKYSSLFATRKEATAYAMRLLEERKAAATLELQRISAQSTALKAPPYVVLNEDSQSCIELQRNDPDIPDVTPHCGRECRTVVFRMLRSDESDRLWTLYAMKDGKPQDTAITRHQYRNDLIERIQSGAYDQHLQA